MTADDRTVQVPVSLIEQVRRWPYYGEVLDFICTFIERSKEPWAREAVEELRSRFGSPTVGEHYAYLEAASEAFVALSQPTPTAEFAIENGWLVEVTNGHTCGGSSYEWPYAHEPGCGMVPIARVEDLLSKPYVPKREQIAEVLAEHYAWGHADEEDREAADKVLALLNGDDRG